MNVNELASIFYSQYKLNTNWEQLSEILWMYQNNLLKIKKVFLISIKGYEDAVNSIESERYKKVFESGDGIRHQALKLIATAHLVDKGVPPPKIHYEYPYLGYEVDVIDSDFCYPIECGDTNAIKVEDYLFSLETKYFLVIPYPEHDKAVYGYEFKAAPEEFIRYLNHKLRFSLEKLKTLKNKVQVK